MRQSCLLTIPLCAHYASLSTDNIHCRGGGHVAIPGDVIITHRFEHVHVCEQVGKVKVCCERSQNTVPCV